MSFKIGQSAFDFCEESVFPPVRLSEHDSLNFQQLPMTDACVSYAPNFLSVDEANIAFEELAATLEWRQDNIVLFGKKMKIPRLQAWYGDSNASYMYSGLLMQAMPWTESLDRLKSRCEKQCNKQFNSVLANLYRNGADSMGMHADDEPELGTKPTIASLTLGAARNFIFKHKLNKQKYSLVLEHGSLLVMQGNTQQYWQHGMNKTKRVNNPRINLTFRYVYQ